MPFKSFNLLGCCRRDFNTEIRYDIASAKADGSELVSLTIPLTDDSNENSRLSTCVCKILSSMKKVGEIQFYLKPDAFIKKTTEADYILNKYSEYIVFDEDRIAFYVKLH